MRLTKLLRVVVVLPALSFLGCAGTAEQADLAEEHEPSDVDAANQALGLDEDKLGDAELAAAIAEAKLAELGDAVAVDKHAGCGRAGSTSSNVRDNDAPSNGAANQRSGSATGCTAVGALQPSDDAFYYCYTVGNDGFTWTYNQNIRTGVRGWTRDDLLDNGGSFRYCGF